MNTTTDRIVRIIHRLAVMTIVASFALVSTASAQMETHNPYTVRGLQIRTNLIPAETTSAYSTMEVDEIGPTLFQEMVPCRFVNTLDHAEYPVRWGGQPFQVSESRVYHPIGYLVEGEFKNPCSELIPSTAVALSLRIASYQPSGNGSVYLAPAAIPNYNRAALLFKQGSDTQQEANVVLEDHSFVVTVADQATELTIDIIGFFIPDPLVYAAKGDRGERGERGEMGPKGDKGDDGVAGAKGEKGDDGVAGAKGEKGDDGVAGAKGEKGDDGVAGAKGEKGDDGVAGAKGEKGDDGVAGAKGEKGDDGVAGAKGEKGDDGVAGAKGEKGDDGVAGAKGEKGDDGVAGAKGEKGDDGVAGAKGEKGNDGVAGAKGEKGNDGVAGAKGEKGDDGVAGAKGEKGNDGVAGAKGEKGNDGVAGAKGEKGDKGDAGAQGAQGPQGPQGPQGIPGLTMSVGTSTFPPGGSITINNSKVRSDSVIILLYIEVSNGNALGVASQKAGSFVASGSPNKPFKYIILNNN